MMFDFPKSKRLLKTNEFKVVFEHGFKKVTKHLVLLAVPSRTGSPSGSDRVGLVVSRKVGNSVVRNRVKRILREHFRKEGFNLGREHTDTLARSNNVSSNEVSDHNSFKPVDLIIIARHTAKSATSSDINESLSSGIRKLQKILDEKASNIPRDAKIIANNFKQNSKQNKTTKN